MNYALLIIDMQQASVARAAPFHDAHGLVTRLNLLARRVRRAAGQVVFVQSTGPEGTPCHSGERGWRLLPDLEVAANDAFLQKSGCDVFDVPDLDSVWGSPHQTTLIITGCDTDYCIDSAVRSALARGYRVIVPEDGHSLTDRPHLSAPLIITHHNAIWSTPGWCSGSVSVSKCSHVPLTEAGVLCEGIIDAVSPHERANIGQGLSTPGAPSAINTYSRTVPSVQSHSSC